MSGGQNLRASPPYSLYRFATKDGLALGTDITGDDISPRSIYFINRNNTLRNINSNDTFVSALEIFEQNDSFLGLRDHSVLDQNWSDPGNVTQSVLNRIRNNPGILNFTAQTPLAASYGMMQVLFTTAISPLGWKGIKSSGACQVSPKDCNPSFLFDTDGNITRGGGTVALASEYLRRGFLRKNPPGLSDDPEFASSSLLETAFENMLRAYNSREQYPREVLDFSRNFPPIPATSIFP